MINKCLIKLGEYHDSVSLMQVARELTALFGVVDAAVVMATEANKSVLREAGLLVPKVEAASANDLAIVVRAVSEVQAQDALRVAEEYLTRRPEPSGAGGSWQPRTLHAAIQSESKANLALISVPGEHAAAEAWQALKAKLHVMLFSDNVSVEDEIALKKYAVEHNLLMMGPDCGTAILNGVALGFANVAPHGPVGIVAAAGTGLQEVSTLLTKQGVGVSQAIGVGGRDLQEAVGGLMMLAGLKALQTDPQTKVLLLVSKPPAPPVVKKILAQVRKSSKPTIICFLGGDPAPISAAGAIPAPTLQKAAYLAAEQAQGHKDVALERLARQTADLGRQAHELKRRLKPGQRYARGLYSGGTLAAEALILWRELLADVRANVGPPPHLADAAHSQGHCVVDLGADEFTVGRPHPMIDQQLRIERLWQEASDPEVALILLDIVLGYGAHPDPAAELAPAIQQASAGRELLVVASVTGSEQDPQRLSRQVRALQQVGVIIAPCNAAAARLAALIVA